MKRIVAYLLSHRIFIPFLVIASVLWYISRLSHEYTTTIDVKVEIIPDFAAEVWIEQESLSFEATVKGDGREIILNQLALNGKISVLASELMFTRIASTSLYTVDASSMQKAIQNRSSGLSFIDLHDIPQVRISPLETRVLPIKSNIDLQCAPQYMILGDLMLSVDSIELKAPLIVLDTLDRIQTKSIQLEGLNSSVSGIAQLILPDYTIANIQNVQYRATVTGYTEIEMVLPVEVKNMPGGMTLALSIPKTTTLRMKLPLMNSYQNPPRAFIDYNYQSVLTPHTRLFPVMIDSIPSNSQIISITPSRVMPLFEVVD